MAETYVKKFRGKALARSSSGQLSDSIGDGLLKRIVYCVCISRMMGFKANHLRVLWDVRQQLSLFTFL